MLYRAVQANLAPFLAQIEERGRALPGFCVRDVAAFLRGGILTHGFARVHCEDCRRDGALHRMLAIEPVGRRDSVHAGRAGGLKEAQAEGNVCTHCGVCAWEGAVLVLS